MRTAIELRAVGKEDRDEVGPCRDTAVGRGFRSWANPPEDAVPGPRHRRHEHSGGVYSAGGEGQRRWRNRRCRRKRNLDWTDRAVVHVTSYPPDEGPAPGGVAAGGPECADPTEHRDL